MLRDRERDVPPAEPVPPESAARFPSRSLSPLPEQDLQSIESSLASVRRSLEPIADPESVSWEDLAPEELELVRDSLTQAMVAESFGDRARRGFVLDQGGVLGCHRLDERGESVDLMISAIRTIAKDLSERKPVIGAAVERANVARTKLLSEPQQTEPAPQTAPPTPPPKLSLSISDNEVALVGVTAQLVEEAAKEALEREKSRNEGQREGNRSGWLSRFFDRFRRSSPPGEGSSPPDKDGKERQETPGRPPRSLDSTSGRRTPRFDDAQKTDSLGETSRFPSQRFAQTGTPEMEDIEPPSGGARSALERSEASIGRLGDMGQMLSSDRRFLASLGVTDIYVVAGRSGELMRLDTFLRILDEKSPSPDNPTFDDLFPARRVPEISRIAETRYGVPYPGVAQCRFKLNGAASVSLPLSPKHSIMGMSFADASGKIVQCNGPIVVREGIFGSCLVRPPPGAAQIIYHVAEKESRAGDRSLIAKLTRVLPSFPSYLAEDDRAFRQALDMLPRRAADNAAIWYHHEIDKGYVYTMNKLAIQYQEGVGQGFDEAISGMRMGICDSFAYHLARGCVALGVPAFSIVGALPKEDAKTFQFNPGHAQTLVYTENGIRIFDLTAHTIDGTVNSWRVARSEKRRIFGRLSSADATNRTVYESGEALGALLRGESAPGSDSVKPHGVGFWGRRFEERGLRESTLDDSRLTYDQTSKLALVEAVSHQLLFERRCEEAKEKGSLNPVRDFVAKRPVPLVSKGDVRDWMPDHYEIIANYDPLRLLAELSKEVALDPAVPHDELSRAVRWIIEGMDPTREVRGELLGAAPAPDGQRCHALGLEQSLAFVCPKTVSIMSIEETAECFVSLLACLSNWIDDRGSTSKDEAAPFTSAVEALEACSARMAHENYSMSYESKLECSARAMRIAGAFAGRVVGDWHLPVIERIASIYSNLDRLSGSPAAQTLWDLGSISDEEVSKGFDLVLASPERLHFFASEESLRSAAALLSSSIATYLSSSIAPFADHATKLERLERAGFPIDLFGSREALKRELFSKLPEHLSTSVDPVPNLASPDTPASTIYLEHTSIEAASLHRTLRAVIRLNGGTEQDLRESWPTRPEEEVGATLLASFDLESRRSLRYKIRGSSSAHVGEIDLTESAVACLDIAGARHPFAGLAIGYLRKLGSYSSERGKLLDGVARICPTEWKERVAEISAEGSGTPKVVTANIAQKLFRERSRPAAYHAMLSQAVDFMDPRTESLHWLQQALESFDPSREGEAKRILNECSWERNTLARHLDVPEEDRLAGILLRATLLTGSSPDPELDMVTVSTATGIPPHLLAKMLRSPSAEKGAPYATMWRTISAVSASRTLRPAAMELWDATLAKAHRVLESDSRSKAAPYARYMFHETGRVLPITSGCEMDELRNYAPGDDIRTIVWSASARIDRLVVKKTRAEEVRPVKLVVDLEWLATDLSSLEDHGEAPKLERLFNQIIMAYEQGVEIDIALVNRARLEEIQRVTAADDGRGIYAGSSAFLSKVLSGMAAARFVLSHEAEIYGAGERPRYNILLANDVQFERDTIAVFALSEANARRTEPVLQQLRRNGVYVAAVKR